MFSGASYIPIHIFLLTLVGTRTVRGSQFGTGGLNDKLENDEIFEHHHTAADSYNHPEYDIQESLPKTKFLKF